MKKFNPNSKALREYKAKLTSLTRIQFETLIGLALGDISIQTQNKGRTYRIKFEWGNINRKYAFHIYKVFKEWILTEPQKRIRTNKNGNQITTWYFQTFSHEAFNPLANLFIGSTGKKTITANLIINNLTPRGLAYWFQDDGGKLDYSPNQGKGIVLNTQSFTKNEVQQLANELQTKFGLICWVKPNKGKSVIVISGESFEKFVALVDPFIIPSMRDKLPSPRKNNK
jgi:hypothetical protein